MPNRRDFLVQAGAVGSLLATGGARAGTSSDKRSSAGSPLNILLLGGTGYIGKHFADAAISRGHRVSVFSRGRLHSNELPDAVERLVGDRDKDDIESIKNRDWDAVFDLAAFVPSWVKTLGHALRGRVKHYTFVSSIVVYRYPAYAEESGLLRYTGSEDPYSFKSIEGHYEHIFALKVLCEEEARKQFPERTLIVRPSTIVGPGEKLGTLTYWVARMQQAGEVLAAGDALNPVQFIDVRDLAEWNIRMAEQQTVGTFNATGPAMPLSWCELLGALRANVSAPVGLTWVPVSWLTDRRLQAFSSHLFWPTESGILGTSRLSNKRARASGLTFRSLSTTIEGIALWYAGLPLEQRGEVLMAFDGKNRSLEYAMRREAELLAEWHGSEAY